MSHDLQGHLKVTVIFITYFPHVRQDLRSKIDINIITRMLPLTGTSFPPAPVVCITLALNLCWKGTLNSN